MNNDFTFYKTKNERLKKLVDFFFYYDISADSLFFNSEDIIPFPRVTLGYFFNHPFSVLSDGETQSVNMIFSRVSTKKVNVQPISNRIKIVGVHLKPFALSYFTDNKIVELPLIIKANELLKNNINAFQQNVHQTEEITIIFKSLEALVLSNLKDKNLSLISKAIELIDNSFGLIKISSIAEQSNTSERTLRNHFKRHIGISPKEYSQLVKLKKVISDLNLSQSNLTSISNEDYFDQSHFIKMIKAYTGKLPQNLKKELPTFRFLQF